MKKILVLAMTAMLAISARAQAPVQDAAAGKATEKAQAAAARVLAIQDNAKAAEALTSEIREMLKDEQTVKGDTAELTIAALVKSDPKRAIEILPLAFKTFPQFVPLALFQRMAAAALLAAGPDISSPLTQAILGALAGQNRWMAAVIDVAKDSAVVLPIGLRQSILIIPAVVLPPAVIPPGKRYSGQ